MFSDFYVYLCAFHTLTHMRNTHMCECLERIRLLQLNMSLLSHTQNKMNDDENRLNGFW